MSLVWYPCNGCPRLGPDDHVRMGVGERHVEIDMDEIDRAAEYQAQLHGWQTPFYIRFDIPHKDHCHSLARFFGGDRGADDFMAESSYVTPLPIYQDTGERDVGMNDKE